MKKEETSNKRNYNKNNENNIKNVIKKNEKLTRHW